MNINLLQTLYPISKIIPSIHKPVVSLRNSQKTIYTTLVLCIFLVLSQIPLYGIQRSFGSDPFSIARTILASNRGTLMQLGISPVITAGWCVMFLSKFGFFAVSHEYEFNRLISVQKLIAMLFCIGQASAYVYYGAYGNPSTMNALNIVLIMLQLCFSGLLIILLDQMLQNGYGLGSGVSLFILLSTCESIFWQMFSPVTFISEQSMQFQGSLVSLIHLICTKQSTWRAIVTAFTRTSGYNLTSLFGTVFIFIILAYLQHFKVRIYLIHQLSKGYRHQVKIKLFFTSTMGVILQSMVTTNLYKISQILYDKFSKVTFIRLLGVWQNGQVISGLAWYLSAPVHFSDFILSPLRSFTYIMFVTITSAWFALLWIHFTKKTPKQMAKRYRQLQLTMPDYHKTSVYEVLNIYVPTATMLGGILIGLLTIVGDMMNVCGSSTGILLSISILLQFQKKSKQNQNQ